MSNEYIEHPSTGMSCNIIGGGGGGCLHEERALNQMPPKLELDRSDP